MHRSARRAYLRVPSSVSQDINICTSEFDAAAFPGFKALVLAPESFFLLLMLLGLLL